MINLLLKYIYEMREDIYMLKREIAEMKKHVTHKAAGKMHMKITHPSSCHKSHVRHLKN